MAIPSVHHILTDRDREILLALNRTPLTAFQLLKLSETFTGSFTSERYVRQRMQALHDAGWVKRWRYATASRGALNYYKITREGFTLLNGPKAPVPSRRFFKPVSLGLQEHTRALADFIVHTLVSAKRSGIDVTYFRREQEVVLKLGSERQLPDCVFQLKTGTNRAFNFLVELDNGTEPVCSKKERESWQKKISFYDRYRDVAAGPFRVLIIVTKEGNRLAHILETARRSVGNPYRSLFYGVSLAQYLSEADVLFSSCFQNHHLRRISLIPSALQKAPRNSPIRQLHEHRALW